MRHDHEFIGIGRVAGLPGRDFQIHFSRRGGGERKTQASREAHDRKYESEARELDSQFRDGRV